MKPTPASEVVADHPEHNEMIDIQKDLSNPMQSDRQEEAMGRAAQEMPTGYFYSARFIGSYCVCPIQRSLSHQMILRT